MRFKYKLINDLLVNEERCITYLQDQAQKGWQLETVGMIFLKFKKTAEKHLKYQMDYSPLTDEYLDLLAMQGYQYVDNYREINFFVNDDINAANLQTDKVTKLMVLKKSYPLWKPFILIFLSLLTYGLSGSINMFQQISWGYFFINTVACILPYQFKITALTLLIDAVIQLLIRYDIYLAFEDKKSIEKIITIFFRLDKIIICGLILLTLFAGISIFTFNPLLIIKLGAIMSLYFWYSNYINKKSYHEINSTKRKIKLLAAIVIYIVIFMIIQNIELKQETDVPLNSLQSASIIKTDTNQSLFVKCSAVIGYSDENNDCIFIESKFACLNDAIARSVFEYQVIDYEKELRIPSEKEIELIVEKTGEWSIFDVEYLSYQEASSNLMKYDTKLVEECYYQDDIYIAIKGDVVLTTKVAKNTSIDAILEYYF